MLFSRSVMSNSLQPQPHGLHAAYQASLSFTISQSLLRLMSIELVMQSNHLILVILFFSCLQSFPASGSFPVSEFFASGGQSIGASASTSVLPMNIQSWFPLGLIGLISLQSKWLSKVSSNTTVLKYQLVIMVEVYFQKLHNSNFSSYSGMNKMLSSFDTLRSWKATF